MQELLRQLPKVDLLLEAPAIRSLMDELPRPLVVKAVRAVLDDRRRRILDGRAAGVDLSLDALAAAAAEQARRSARPRLKRVINAAGVVIHTNLGRSLLAESAMEAVADCGRHYSNLEFDLAAGRRGSRYSHVEALLCDLTGAQAALVVNNNAAAVLICLATLAPGREVVVSRGELVEIGGSFRIPDVMAASGAVLREVGTTNKTHLRDYEAAINEDTALLLKVHQSNFRIVGFSQQVDAVDLKPLAQSAGLPLMEDLGSGSLVDFSQYGLRREPTVQEAVKSGADVVCFSGDKLLGGPQAGIIVGERSLVDRVRTNPLNRAMRIDKFTVSALEATLRLYLEEKTAAAEVPTLRMITADYDGLAKRAARLKRAIARAKPADLELGLTDGYSRIGGGALPDQGLKTRLVTVAPTAVSVNELEEALRGLETPIIARIENDRLLLDVRTVKDEEFGLIAAGLLEASRKKAP